MSDVNLRKEEMKLLRVVEAGEFESILTKKRRAPLLAAAKNTTRKDKHMHEARMLRQFHEEGFVIFYKLIRRQIPARPRFASTLGLA